MWQKKDIVNEFQRLGKRITKQRMVILDVILEQNWTDCKEVYYEAVQRDSTVGLSTVYRTIRMLEEMGVLKRVYSMFLPMNRENRSMGRARSSHRNFTEKAGSERLKKTTKNAVPSARHKRDNCQKLTKFLN